MDGIIMLLETEETNCCHTFNWRKKEKKKPTLKTKSWPKAVSETTEIQLQTLKQLDISVNIPVTGKPLSMTPTRKTESR